MVICVCVRVCVAGSVGKFSGHGADGSSVLSAGWTTADYSQQHRPGAGV